MSLMLMSAGCSVDASGTGAGDFSPDDTGPVFGDTSVERDTFVGLDSTPPSDSGGSDTSTPIDSDRPDTTPPPDTAPPPDTTPPPDTAPPCDLSACGAAPVGAKRAALIDATAACPAGFKTTDVVEAMDGEGCGCACGAPTGGSCPDTAAISTSYSDDARCGTTGVVLHPSGCTSLGGDIDFGGSHFSGTVPSPTGQSCAASRTTNKAAQTHALHLCEADASTCFGPACAKGFTECIEVSGACPSSYPNGRKVGTDVSLACATACTCGGVGGAKCGGTVDFYSGSSCGAGTKTSFTVDGSCLAVTTKLPVKVYQYTPSGPAGGSCTPSFVTAPGTTSLTGARSFCCR